MSSVTSITELVAFGAATLTFTASVIGVVLSIRNGRRLEKSEETNRTNHDDATMKIAELATMLLRQNELTQEQVASLEEQKQLAEQQLEKTNEANQTLATIHTLVNGNLLNAQRRELQATRASLDSMREVVQMKQDAGIPVQPETLAAIELLETQVRGLATEIHIKEMAIANFSSRVHGDAIDPIISKIEEMGGGRHQKGE